MSPFDFWLLIVGLAVGAGLAAIVMVDLRRRDDDISGREVRSEAAWIADTLRREEIAADAEAVEEVLRLHRAYLAGMPDERAWSPASPMDAAAAVEGGSPAEAAPATAGDPSPPSEEAALPARAEPAEHGLPDPAPVEDH